MTDGSAPTRRLLVVALLGVALAIMPTRGVEDSWRAPTADHSVDDAATVTAERDAPPSHLLDRAADVSPFKAAVTWTPLLVVLAALAVRIPLLGRHLARSAASARRDQIRQRPHVPRAPPAFAITS